MSFTNSHLTEHYDRLLRQLGTDDPYNTSSTLGILEVLRAHFLIVDFFLSEGRELGGIGPKSFDLLHSALHRPLVEFDGIQRWTDPLDKAATTLFGLIKNHPFHDANKRTALLSTLYLLSKQGLMPKNALTKKEFEDFTVEIAEMGIEKRSRYRELAKAADDAEVKYIAYWLRRRTRKIDYKEYLITVRDLRKILAGFGFVLDNPKDNMIDVCKIEKRHSLFGLGALKEVSTRITRLGYHSETKQVTMNDIRKLRKDCKLTVEYGVDSESFYRGTDEMTSLLFEYQDHIRRLANR
jgi:prophage maintenance system killer protein